ncbi:hypothetical protein ACFSJY_12035 [Thalassotalea euphylliae]|uniref:hypothetical protein n=1 Tax=Thalassotalea euphylliae TaxID=1655234 RepID=UPI003627A0C9
MRLLTVLILIIASTGCTNKQLYQVGQNYEQSECIRNAQSAEEHQTCYQKRKSYKEYKKEREAVIDKS